MKSIRHYLYWGAAALALLIFTLKPSPQTFMACWVMFFMVAAAVSMQASGRLCVTTFPTNNCDPRFIQVDDTTGSTLTRANIRAFTKQDFEDQQYKEVGMDRIIAATKEARMTGVRERSLMDLLLSRHVALKQPKGAPQGSVIAPYRLVPRQSVINANYFLVEAGVVHPTAGVGSIPASAWRITVNTGVSSFKTALTSIEKYFLTGAYLNIQYVDSVSAVLRNVQFKILSAANANAGGVEKATVDLEPNYTAAGFAALAGADQLLYQPTTGTAFLLHNSVSDYEAWKHQGPGVNNLTLIEYWEQTVRETFEYNEEYLAALNSPLTSDFFKKFRSLPLAQQRKQQAMLNEIKLFNTFFYGERINEKQTVEGYTNLPQVVDPANTSQVIEFKSNTLGVRTQLNACGRLSDRQGAALDLDTIFESGYLLKRNRETTSGNIDVIDCMTDRRTAARIHDIMIKYYKSRFSSDLTMYVQAGQKITFNGQKVLEYNLYDIPDHGYQLAVFTDPYFDDRLAAFDTANKSGGRSLWLIDWSDVNINVLRTNSANRTTNVADSLYFDVIKPVINKCMLNSKTIEVQVGDSNRHALIENFSDACPSVTVAGCDLA